MDEANWLASTDPGAMLAALQRPNSEFRGQPAYNAGRPPSFSVSDRKLRLWACGCARAMGHKDAGVLLRPVEHAADHGLVPMSAWHALERVMPCEGFRWCCRVDAAEAARVWSESTTIAGPGEKAALLRDVVPNPFRGPGNLFFLGSRLQAMAEKIYRDRDFAALPILADAIEDGGSRDAELLAHLRGNSVHVLGCWALDLILGKE